MLKAEVRHNYVPNCEAYTNFKHGTQMKSRITGSAMTSKDKGHGDEVTWSISRERKIPETSKLS